MPIPVRPRITSPDADYLIETTDDGSRTLVRQHDGVAFHSGCGAATECDHVYLNNAGMSGPSDAWPIAILEIGLGTAMAMLRTLDRSVTSSRPIQYYAMETRPLPRDVLELLDLRRGLVHPSLVDDFLQWWPAVQHARDGSSIVWQVDPHRSVEVCRNDLRDGVPEMVPPVDAIYFDPFDPATNPELWQPPIFAELLSRTRPGGRLVTYCVKSDVRRALESVGWQTQRVPGPPGGKREVMIASRPLPPA